MAPAPGPAAGALNGPHAIADRPAGQRDKPRERVVPPLASHDRAEVGRVNRRGRARAGQGDRARLAMTVVEVHIAPDQRILVRSGRQPGQQLGESNARCAGGDRGERAAIFGRSFGLGVKQIEMARTAPQPDEQDRFGFSGLGRRNVPWPAAARANGAAKPARRNVRRLTPCRFRKESSRRRSSPWAPLRPICRCSHRRTGSS